MIWAIENNRLPRHRYMQRNIILTVYCIIFTYSNVNMEITNPKYTCIVVFDNAYFFVLFV